MFDNVGEKLKRDARGVFIFGCVIGVVGAMMCLIIAMEEESFESVSGYLIASLITISASVLVARLIYGFGILVEKAEKEMGVEKKTTGQYLTSNAQSQAPAIQHKPEKVEFVFDEGEANPFAEDAEFVDVYCPRCREKLSFVSGTQSGTCPSCGANFEL